MRASNSGCVTIQSLGLSSGTTSPLHAHVARRQKIIISAMALRGTNAILGCQKSISKDSSRRVSSLLSDSEVKLQKLLLSNLKPKQNITFCYYQHNMAKRRTYIFINKEQTVMERDDQHTKRRNRKGR
ncbi:hypothetical protein TanjilG_25714 [Lupinus angustifolius]|uniref:Uncharacterized protein n=1 Tax=Lupinus angustifolius TaxID=3871 RepID=A0A1J7H4I9_LUPAN|nr:hypothetical protein TanjilG_25714 [Lupinus angustifolius]